MGITTTPPTKPEKPYFELLGEAAAGCLGLVLYLGLGIVGLGIAVGLFWRAMRWAAGF